MASGAEKRGKAEGRTVNLDAETLKRLIALPDRTALAVTCLAASRVT